MQTQLLLSLTIEELKDIIKECLSEILENKLLKKEPPEELLSRKEVASLLQISLPTLHKKQKDGKIRPKLFRIAASLAVSSSNYFIESL